ncbi:hypothetical protein DFH07DRAFT_769718 [Mycena maculata]|uniref:Uncharacterized protein n=1 Tax=Mycena maculata TaxID=230809 RepID=A0AAD7JKX1_9AGAR|nr:hypothetical protein DFH07DRAFT_769718 [Mycena maculata]
MYPRSTVNTNYVNDRRRARHVGASVSESELAPELRKQARAMCISEYEVGGRGLLPAEKGILGVDFAANVKISTLDFGVLHVRIPLPSMFRNYLSSPHVPHVADGGRNARLPIAVINISSPPSNPGGGDAKRISHHCHQNSRHPRPTALRAQKSRLYLSSVSAVLSLDIRTMFMNTSASSVLIVPLITLLFTCAPVGQIN